MKTTISIPSTGGKRDLRAKSGSKAANGLGEMELRSFYESPFDAENVKPSAPIRNEYAAIPLSYQDPTVMINDSSAAAASKTSSKSKHVYVIISIVAVFAIMLMTIGLNSSGEMITGRGKIQLPPMSIELNTETLVYSVIDNEPVVSSSKPHVLATGKYIRNVNDNGWNYLEVETFDMTAWLKSNLTAKHISQPIIIEEYIRTMQALGYLEGFVTCHEMNAWYVNFYSGLFDGGDPTDDALNFLEANHDWMVMQTEKNYNSSDYWLQVKGLLSQLEGVVAGAKDGCPGSEQNPRDNPWTVTDTDVFLPSLHKKPALIHLLLMNANGDLYQIAEKFQQENAPPSSVLSDYPVDDDYHNSSSSAKPKSQIASKVWRRRMAIASSNSTTAAEAAAAEIAAKATAIQKENIAKAIGMSARKEKMLTHGVVSKHELTGDNGVKKPKLSHKFKHVDNTPATTEGGDEETNRENRKVKREKTEEEKSEAKASKAQQRKLTPINKNHRNDHCSAIIKLLADKSDIIFAHNTWDDYQCAGPRIFKQYRYNNMKYHRPNNMFQVIFSSSPGLLSSIDDYYLIHNDKTNMAVMETSLDVYNDQLLNLVLPQSMLSWTRSRLANQMSHSGTSWADIFSQFHSGTYVNQWMVMDFKRFTPGQDPLTGFLTVLEEVPGYIHYEDMTVHLVNETYWASYNNPYFEDISLITGQYQLCEENPINCYDTDPRAKIFKREHGKIKSVGDVQVLLGLNRYQTDPLSLNDSCNVSHSHPSLFFCRNLIV